MTNTTVHFKGKVYLVCPNGEVYVVVTRVNRHNPHNVPTYKRQLRSQTPTWRMVRHMASVQPKDDDDARAAP